MTIENLRRRLTTSARPRGRRRCAIAGKPLLPTRTRARQRSTQKYLSIRRLPDTLAPLVRCAWAGCRRAYPRPRFPDMGGPDAKPPAPFREEFASRGRRRGPRHLPLVYGMLTSRICFAASFRCTWCRLAPGHANPAVTLNIYAHLLPGQQEGAAAVVDLALRSALED